jgi:glyoxylase-like metal-dependent hydrolase (beta-lactamase superfamily II)
MAHPVKVADGVWQLQTLLSNVFLVGNDDGSNWFLIDAGFYGHSEAIRRAAAELFGEDARPSCIVLTHGHFDHVGSLQSLLAAWDVPVYAHTLEFPHLTGRVPYPPADPTVGGGLMAWSSRLYPHGPFEVGPRLLALPPNGILPHADGWHCIHTPGHTDGHVSLYRTRDRLLVAGDAIVTVKQESALAVAMQRPEVHGPPAYFTSDWDRSRDSARTLAALEPEILATGHGIALRGESMRAALHTLADQFDGRARPRRGRYVRQPAIVNEKGDMVLPPDPLPGVMATWAAAIIASLLVLTVARQRRLTRHSGLPVPARG